MASDLLQGIEVSLSCQFTKTSAIIQDFKKSPPCAQKSFLSGVWQTPTQVVCSLELFRQLSTTHTLPHVLIGLHVEEDMLRLSMSNPVKSNNHFV